MSDSNSSPTNTTQTSTNVRTDNLNASGNTGPTNVGSGNLTANTNSTTNVQETNISTDQGAVAAGKAIGLASIKSNTDLTSQALNESTGLAKAAFDTTTTLTDSSYQFADRTIAGYEGAVSELADKFTTSLSSFAGQQQTQLGNTVEALNTIATQQSASGDQQVINAVQATQQSLTTIVKYVAIAAVAVGVLYLALKKG